MRAALVAVPVLVLVCGCNTGYTPGSTGIAGGGPPIGLGDAGATDGGVSDAGLDGGLVSDAGCTALSLNATPIADNCFGGNLVYSGSVSVNATSCAVDITTGAGGVCSGNANGASDAFDGGCNGRVCSSPSLPGLITCANGATPCTIKVCDAGLPCP